jgi:hypothetical protein
MKQLLESRFAPSISRAEEIQPIIDVFEGMCRNSTRKDNVFIVSGPPLSGKTALMEETRRFFSNDSIATTGIDFDTFDLTGGEEVGRRRIVASIAAQISNAARVAIGYSLDMGATADDNAGRLINGLKDVSFFQHSRPQVLFFDSIEACPPETLKWVEEKILGQVLDDDALRKTIIIFGSRAVPNSLGADYLTHGVSNRVGFKNRIKLGVFTAEQTSQQLQNIKVDNLLLDSIGGVESLVDITGGLPGLNDSAARWINENPKGSKTELLKYLVEETIFGCRAGEGESFGYLRKDLIQFALLPSFDEEILVKLAPQKSLPEVRHDIRGLMKSQVIEPIDGGKLAMDRQFAATLVRYVQQENPGLLIQTDEKAAEYYKKEVEMKNFAAIGDRLFHLGRLRQSLDLSVREGIEVSSDEQLAHELKEVVVSLGQQSYPTQTAMQRIKETVEGELPGVFAPAAIALFKEALST